MRSWPSGLTEGIKEALRSPGLPAVRGLLAAMLGAGESGAVFLGSESDVRLLAAVPSEAPFREPSVLTLARRAGAGEADAVFVPDGPGSAERPRVLAFTLPERQGALVLLADVGGVSAELRGRARLLVPLLAVVLDLEHTSVRARRAEALRRSLQQILELARSGRSVEAVSEDLLALVVGLADAEVGGLWVRQERQGDLELRAVRRGKGAARPRRVLGRREVEQLGLPL